MSSNVYNVTSKKVSVAIVPYKKIENSGSRVRILARMFGQLSLPGDGYMVCK